MFKNWIKHFDTRFQTLSLCRDGNGAAASLRRPRRARTWAPSSGRPRAHRGTRSRAAVGLLFTPVVGAVGPTEQTLPPAEECSLKSCKNSLGKRLGNLVHFGSGGGFKQTGEKVGLLARAAVINTTEYGRFNGQLYLLSVLEARGPRSRRQQGGLHSEASRPREDTFSVFLWAVSRDTGHTGLGFTPVSSFHLT